MRSARRRKNHLRAYGPPGFVEWIHEQPCVACDYVGASECAHLGNGGMSRKSDWTQTVPLCGIRTNVEWFAPGCHWMLDKVFGKAGFEEEFGIDLNAEAEKTQAAWLSSLGSSPGGET